VKFLYLSRNNNRFGYHILRHLIRKKIKPAYLCLPSKKIINSLIINYFIKLYYYLLNKYYNSEKLYFLNSESILAEKNNIEVRYFSRLNQSKLRDLIKKANIKLIFIGGGWSYKFNKKILNLKNLKIVNLHPSYLPNFKGTSVTRWQVFEYPKFVGTSLHFLDKKFDSGRIIKRCKMLNVISYSPQIMFEKMLPLAKKLTNYLFFNLKKKKITGSKNLKSKIYGNWYRSKYYNKVNLSMKLEKIYHQIKANTQEMNFYPSIEFRLNNYTFFIKDLEFIKNCKKRISTKNSNYLEFFKKDKKGLYFTKNNSKDMIIIKRIQFSKFYKFRRSLDWKVIDKIKDGDKLYF
jgi:methionyl-tRNA formyltransferase